MVARTAEQRFGALGRMGIVAGFHAALLFVLARSFGIMPAFEKEPPRVITDVFSEPPREIIDPPPAGPVLEDPRVYVPEPEVPAVERDTLVPPVSLTGTNEPPPRTDTGSAEPRPLIEAVRMDARHPLTQPPYPIARIRNNDEGTVDLEVYVMPNGRIGDARVLKSSGFDDFDLAALQEARRSWRLAPATRDGVPFAQWYSLRVVFKLKNQ